MLLNNKQAEVAEGYNGGLTQKYFHVLISLDLNGNISRTTEWF